VLIAFASGKGGVGKTTSAIALAAALRELGLDPVLIDLDTGADLTWSLGFEPGDAALGVVGGPQTLAEAAVESAEGLRLVPGSPALIALEERPVAAVAERLRTVARDALLLVDTAPGFTPVATRAVIAAADALVVPFVPEPTAERRARDVLDVASFLGVEPVVLGIAVQVDYRRLLTAEILAQAREGGLAPVAEVPRSVLVPESQNAGESVIAYARTSPVADAYRIAAKALRKALRL
jgi:cellulose biosynthesis protein BcsQ